MIVNILGEEYTIFIKKFEEDDTFSRCNATCYCYSLLKQIVCCDISTLSGWKHAPKEAIMARQKKSLRYAIVCAFLEESVHPNTVDKDRDIVNWFAIQGPKIYKAWQEAEAL